MRPGVSLRTPFYTPLDNCQLASTFYDELSIAGGIPVIGRKVNVSSTTEGYIAVDDNPIGMADALGPMVDLGNLTGIIIAERLGRIINTYWMATLAPIYITGRVQGTWRDAYYGSMFNGNNTNAQVSVLQEIYVCHTEWFLSLLVSSILLFVVGVVGTFFNYLTLGPRIIGRLSSLTRDNPHIPMALGGSTLDANERVKMLKDVKVKLGDVLPESDVGHIALSSVDGRAEVGTLRKGRFYM
jgi:hypothetical protein